MPDRDFDLYLSLLSRFLRLKPAQMREISDELRDHLEERVEELSARGVPRDEAIKAALDEFGDAAQMAQHFTQVTRLKRRRVVMRLTAGTVLAATAALLLVAAFSPSSPETGAVRVAYAQGDGKSAGGGSAPGRVVEESTSETDLVEEKLDQRIEVHFENVPLREALQFISDELQVDVLLNVQTLENAGVQNDAVTSLQIKYSSIKARTALELILANFQLSFTVRDGLIHVIGVQDSNELVVYPIQDLVRDLKGQADGLTGGQSEGTTGGAAGMTMGMGAGSPMPGQSRKSMKAAMHGGGDSGSGMMMGGMGGGMGGMGGGMGGMMVPAGAGGGGFGGAPSSAAYSVHTLAELIATTIAPESWSVNGGTGTLVEYDGLLVVNQNPVQHARIVKLLRAAKTARPDRDYPAINKGQPVAH